MLVLSRKPGESVTIGDEVRVTVLGISGKQIRIGIEAPSEVAVHREEVYNRITKNETSEQADKKSTLSELDSEE